MPRTTLQLSAFLLFLTLILPACQSAPSTSSLTPNPQPLPPLVTLDADIDTLAAALPDALAQIHWSPLNLVNDVADLSLIALTEDDRTVELHAQLNPDRQSSLQLRVGVTGDPELEKQFLVALDQSIKNWRRLHPPSPTPNL